MNIIEVMRELQASTQPYRWKVTNNETGKRIDGSQFNIYGDVSIALTPSELFSDAWEMYTVG